ncbi:Ankyrin repeat-containing protein, putative [Theobroma cacao]|uniref:Ankyrin repeat-containing protein, putative n=1 Tax=Theobroma cacao TaxID=3641 RepID=A0A061FLY4_THECC|nr:Ankyrin repeat-containing protein, putative [Theobroma cacao]
MDERLRRAAQLGNIDALYDLIEDDADVLRRIDEMEFVDTPLHIAAAQGHTEFAMGLMNLKPSFARKLNQRCFSPIHLALQEKQEKMVDDLLSIDKDLVRVKGREGYTPLHHAVREGNVPLLSKFLKNCPNSIFDLTNRKETALHIAAQNNNLEAFQAILFWIQKTRECHYREKRRILNLQDKDGNTVLHIAASNNQTQMIKLLIESKKVDSNTVNRSGFTALRVLQEQARVDSGESVNILKRAEDPVSPLSVFTKSSIETDLDQLSYDISKMNVDTINALLVVFALILTMTYQALLSPPGGAEAAGKSVLKPYMFILFYTSNLAAFAITWFLAVFIIQTVAREIAYFVDKLFILIWFCYIVAHVIISPPPYAGWVAFAAAYIIGSSLFVIGLRIRRKRN